MGRAVLKQPVVVAGGLAPVTPAEVGVVAGPVRQDRRAVVGQVDGTQVVGLKLSHALMLSGSAPVARPRRENAPVSPASSPSPQAEAPEGGAGDRTDIAGYDAVAGVSYPP